jgi:NADP-dependent 3-hydroxy acid dehydrogenase YdfG
LAADGSRLALIGRRTEPLAELAKELSAGFIAGDLTDGQFVEGVSGALERLWGSPPDVLVNNAGEFSIALITETDPEVFERTLAVNLKAPFALTRAVLPDMLKRGSGHVINIGSIAGRVGFGGNAAYSASKFGLLGLHKVLVEELRGTGVKTTWIEPSAIDTPLWDALDPDNRPDLPSRSEMLRPESVAEAVSFVVGQSNDVNIEELVIRANPRTG